MFFLRFSKMLQIDESDQSKSISRIFITYLLLPPAFNMEDIFVVVF